ncbi:MAG: hypothetical protein R2764_15280 [Bacteroidales bacterium]
MHNPDLKNKVLNACIKQQLETIENLKSVMEEAQRAANDYGLPKDRYDSFRSQLLRKRDMFAQQLARANEQLDLLRRIPIDKDFQKVEFGALVITNKQRLLISIGIGKLQVDGEDYFAISPGVPIYKAMEGKQEGEELALNNNVFEILKIL